MSKRLQVVLADGEYEEIRRVAQRAGMTVSEWVRQVLRTARREIPGGDSERKVETVRAASEHAFPTADMDRMLAEIESGYLGGSAS